MVSFGDDSGTQDTSFFGNIRKFFANRSFGDTVEGLKEHKELIGAAAVVGIGIPVVLNTAPKVHSAARNLGYKIRNIFRRR